MYRTLSACGTVAAERLVPSDLAHISFTKSVYAYFAIYMYVCMSPHMFCTAGRQHGRAGRRPRGRHVSHLDTRPSFRQTRRATLRRSGRRQRHQTCQPSGQRALRRRSQQQHHHGGRPTDQRRFLSPPLSPHTRLTHRRLQVCTHVCHTCQWICLFTCLHTCLLHMPVPVYVQASTHFCRCLLRCLYTCLDIRL